jgi:hypothetical protein
MKTFKNWFKPVNKKIKYDVSELKQGDKVEKEHLIKHPLYYKYIYEHM